MFCWVLQWSGENWKQCKDIMLLRKWGMFLPFEAPLSQCVMITLCETSFNGSLSWVVILGGRTQRQNQTVSIMLQMMSIYPCVLFFFMFWACMLGNHFDDAVNLISVWTCRVGWLSSLIRFAVLSDKISLKCSSFFCSLYFQLFIDLTVVQSGAELAAIAEMLPLEQWLAWHRVAAFRASNWVAGCDSAVWWVPGLTGAWLQLCLLPLHHCATGVAGTTAACVQNRLQDQR